MSATFTDTQIQKWIADPLKDPRNGRKIKTTAKNGIYAKLQREAMVRGLLSTPTTVTPTTVAKTIQAPQANPLPLPLPLPLPPQIPKVNSKTKTLPKLKPLSNPAIPKVPVVSGLKLPSVVQPAVQPVVQPPKLAPLQPKAPDSGLVIQEHTFSNPFSTGRAKYYLYCGLDEMEEEPGMVLVVNSNWSGLVDELWQQAHLLESLVEHGIGLIEVPIEMMDFKDFIPFSALEGNENPNHPLHYLDPKFQLPTISEYLNKDYDLQEARMTIEYLSGLEEHFPDLGSLGDKSHEKLLQTIENELAPIITKRKEWESKYLEYYTDEDWFYIDFLKMTDDLSVDEFAELCHKTFKKRVPETWLAERYRDTEDIEEFLAHFECTIDELYGSELNREGSDEYEERLNTIISEFHRIKQQC